MSFTKIKIVYLPKTLGIIGNSAFSASSIEEVHLGNKITKIGDFAFEECKKLKKLEVPKSVTEIGEYIFMGRENDITVSVYKDSAIHKYAKKNDLKFKVLDAENEKEVVKYTVVKVKKGDTLWKISSKYLGNGNRYKDIMKLNKLKSSSISVGQKLKVPTK